MLMAYIIKAGDIGSFEEVYEFYTGKVAPGSLENSNPPESIKAHMELESLFKEKLKSHPGLSLLKEIELPLVPVLFEMETQGISLDVHSLEEQEKDLKKDIRELEELIYEAVEEEFNISSPQQLANALFQKMGFPPSKKTKTGYSTSGQVLQKLAVQYPICQNILEYRELTKLKSTYVDTLPQLVDNQTERIHTRFRQAATTTGRLSSNSPQLTKYPHPDKKRPPD